jgi:hypothetical protein
MRQLIAATVLLAFMAAPAVYFLRDTPEVRAVAHAVGSGIDEVSQSGAAEAVLEGMRRVAAGLGESLEGARAPTGTFSVATIRDKRPGHAPATIGQPADRRDTAVTGSIGFVDGNAVADPDDDVAPAWPDRRKPSGGQDGGAGLADRTFIWRTSVTFAANGGGAGLPRNYPTSFLWFDLV